MRSIRSMTDEGTVSVKWQWLTLGISSIIMQLVQVQAAPLPQNPMETIALGTMTLAGNAMEILQNGGAVRRDRGFETPFLAAHSKTEVGMGDAMRNRAESDEDSDEDRRRKRRRRRHIGIAVGQTVDLLGETAMLPLAQSAPHMHRGKRSPCHTNTMQPSTADGGGDDGGEDVEEVARRRAARRNAAQKKRSTAKSGKSTTKTKSKKFALQRRRRRQTEVTDLANGNDVNAKDAANQFSEHAKKFAEKMHNVWDKFINTMTQVVQQVKKSLSGAAGKEDYGSGSSSSIPAPADAEIY